MALSEELKILAFTAPAAALPEMPIYYGERMARASLNIWRDGFGNLLLLRMRLVLGRRRRAAVVTALAAARRGRRGGCCAGTCEGHILSMALPFAHTTAGYLAYEVVRRPGPHRPALLLARWRSPTGPTSTSFPASSWATPAPIIGA